jgi:hypothetical protein
MTELSVPVCCDRIMILKAVSGGMIFYQCSKCLKVEMIG